MNNRIVLSHPNLLTAMASEFLHELTGGGRASEGKLRIIVCITRALLLLRWFIWNGLVRGCRQLRERGW